MISVFTEKDVMPSGKDVKNALGDTFPIWQELALYTKKLSPQFFEEWNFSGAKYGWSYRIKDKKRILIYLLPRDQFFKIAFVFGEKATSEILKSKIAENIKAEIKNAKFMRKEEE